MGNHDRNYAVAAADYRSNTYKHGRAGTLAAAFVVGMTAGILFYDSAMKAEREKVAEQLKQAKRLQQEAQLLQSK